MPRLALYLLYLAAALRGSLQIAARRDPRLSIALLVIFGLLLFSEPWLSGLLAQRGQAAARAYQTLYLLIQIGLILGILLPGATPDTPLILFFPLAYQAVQFFGWKAGRWWVCAFLAPMLAYPLVHADPNNRIMVFIYEGGCLLLGALAHLTDKARAARAANLRMAEELRAAQAELQKYTRQVEELAAEKAHTALARELHDSVTQTVFSMNLAVEAARLMLPQGSQATASQLDRVQGLAQNALAEIHELVGQLGSNEKDAQDLVSGIRALVRRYCLSGNLEVELSIEDGSRALSMEVAARLCRIVQEALTNVQKHAGTEKVRVHLNLAALPACIEVEDEGHGFDLDAALHQPGHIGLSAMAERAGEIGWKLSIQSQPGRGTRIRIQEALEAPP